MGIVLQSKHHEHENLQNSLFGRLLNLTGYCSTQAVLGQRNYRGQFTQSAWLWTLDKRTIQYFNMHQTTCEEYAIKFSLVERLYPSYPPTTSLSLSLSLSECVYAGATTGCQDRNVILDTDSFCLPHYLDDTPPPGYWNDSEERLERQRNRGIKIGGGERIKREEKIRKC